jgi:hypothetical protein
LESKADFRYDLMVGMEVESEVMRILRGDIKVEVKHDRYDNDNFFIEYMYDDKNGTKYPTGISTSQADYYVLSKKDYMVILPIDKLKNLVKLFAENNKPIRGGDYNHTLGFLIPITFLMQRT